MRKNLQWMMLGIFTFIMLLPYGMTAQEMEIYSSSTRNKFNANGDVTQTLIFASGVKNGEVLNVEIILDPAKVITQLKINDKPVIKPRYAEYKKLTDYVIAEVTQEPTGKEQTTTRSEIILQPGEEPPKADRLTDDDRRKVMDLIKNELIKDKLISDPKVFDFMLTFDALYINAKKQPQTIFEKYKSFYQKHADIKLTRNTYFQMTQQL